MQTVDFHTHLLSSRVKFDRLYDRIAIRLFAHKLGIDPREIIKNPYQAYTDALMKNIKNSPHISKVVLFGVDAKVNNRGDILHQDLTVCATNSDLYQLYQQNRDLIIPFFSINPMRPDALDLIDEYYKKGFKGAKFLQNYWGVDTRDKRYRAYFEKLKAKNLPLIIHVGSESSVHSYRDCESLNMIKQPLEIGLNVVAAHMALSYKKSTILKAFSKKPKNFNSDYFKLLEMLESNNNLYADISAILTPVRAKVLRHLSQQSQIHDKLLFGTDFPVPFSTIFTTYDIPIKKRLEIERKKNPFERYIKAIKEYFDEDNPIFSNYKRLI